MVRFKRKKLKRLQLGVIYKTKNRFHDFWFIDLLNSIWDICYFFVKIMRTLIRTIFTFWSVSLDWIGLDRRFTPCTLGWNVSFGAKFITSPVFNISGWNLKFSILITLASFGLKEHFIYVHTSVRKTRSKLSNLNFVIKQG